MLVGKQVDELSHSRSCVTRHLAASRLGLFVSIPFPFPFSLFRYLPISTLLRHDCWIDQTRGVSTYLPKAGIGGQPPHFDFLASLSSPLAPLSPRTTYHFFRMAFEQDRKKEEKKSPAPAFSHTSKVELGRYLPRQWVGGKIAACHLLFHSIGSKCIRQLESIPTLACEARETYLKTYPHTLTSLL